PVPPPRRDTGGGAACPVGARRLTLLPDSPAPGAHAHAEPGGDLLRLARRVSRLIRVVRVLQPIMLSLSLQLPVATSQTDPVDRAGRRESSRTLRSRVRSPPRTGGCRRAARCARARPAPRA